MSRRVCNEHFKCRKSILYLLEQVPEGPCPDDVSCEFELGKFYAIVGQFGSGKTTLLSMLAWLGDPDEGRVVSEGKAVREIGSERHRREAIPRAQQL